jgi:hypothetical protein
MVVLGAASSRVPPLARCSWWQPTVACSAVDKMDLPCLPVNTTNYEHSLHPHEHASSLPSAARFLIARCPPCTAQETHSLRLVGVAPRPRSVVPASHYSFIASKLLLFFSSQPASQPASSRPHSPRSPPSSTCKLAKKTSPSFLAGCASELTPLQPAVLDSAVRGCCDVPRGTCIHSLTKLASPRLGLGDRSTTYHSFNPLPSLRRHQTATRLPEFSAAAAVAAAAVAAAPPSSPHADPSTLTPTRPPSSSTVVYSPAACYMVS